MKLALDKTGVDITDLLLFSLEEIVHLRLMSHRLKISFFVCTELLINHGLRY